MITKLCVQNFKCFAEERTLQFSRFNVLYGKNGRGKSTIIQALLLLSQNIKKKDSLTNVSLKGNMVDLVSYSDVINRYQPKDTIHFKISTDIDDDLTMEFGKSESGLTLLHLEDLWHGEEQLISSVGTQTEISDTKNSTAMSGIKALEFFRQLRYVSANRRGPANYEERQDDFLIDDIGSTGERLINALSKQDKEFIESFECALSFILSGATISIKDEEDSDYLELMLDSMDGSLGFRPSNVGFGYSFVLPVIYQILSATPDSTIIIENPEAHLYPGAQSRLVEWIVSESNKKHLQIILETHSDHIINGLRIAVKKGKLNRKDVSIQFVDRRSDKNSPEIVHIKMDSNGTLSENPTDFMDEWTRQMLDLL